MKAQWSTLRTSNLFRFFLGSLALLLAFPGAAVGNDVVAEVENHGDGLVFHPVVEFDQLVLTVTGPCDFQHRKVYREGAPIFRLDDETIDGTYTYSLVVIPRIDPEIVEILQVARRFDDAKAAKQLCREGRLPGPPANQSGGFLVSHREIIFDPGSSEDKVASTEGPTDADGGIPFKDFVILDDLIVDGSACIGFDCVNGESFGFDTVRLKENNLRIKFDDTSTAASFPRNDWQITANDSANGGASKFSIDDIGGNRTPFTVEANARSHSLYVDDGGRIGSRTSTPSTEIHTIDGDTPTLRLQQDGSSGFAPQTWDVAGNETNFFIRDVTNGSQLPFRIRPNAPTSSIDIASDGDVGIGTASPAGRLHVEHSSGNDSDDFVVLEDGDNVLVGIGTTSPGAELEVATTEGAGAAILLTVNSGSWSFANNGTNFAINSVGVGGANEVIVNGTTGDMTILGDYFSTTCGGSPCAPDYVFESDYELMDLDVLEDFVQQNKHLPNIPSAEELTGPINLSKMQMKLLEKIEELTLYTLDQQRRIDSMNEENSELRERLTALENGLRSVQ